MWKLQPSKVNWNYLYVNYVCMYILRNKLIDWLGHTARYCPSRKSTDHPGGKKVKAVSTREHWLTPFPDNKHTIPVPLVPDEGISVNVLSWRNSATTSGGATRGVSRSNSAGMPWWTDCRRAAISLERNSQESLQFLGRSDTPGSPSLWLEELSSIASCITAAGTSGPDAGVGEWLSHTLYRFIILECPVVHHPGDDVIHSLLVPGWTNPGPSGSGPSGRPLWNPELWEILVPSRKRPDPPHPGDSHYQTSFWIWPIYPANYNTQTGSSTVPPESRAGPPASGEPH